MDMPEHFVSFSGGGYTVSGLVTVTDWEYLHSGAECWIAVHEAQSCDEGGRLMDLGEIRVLCRDGELAERTPDTPEHP